MEREKNDGDYSSYSSKAFKFPGGLLIFKSVDAAELGWDQFNGSTSFYARRAIPTTLHFLDSSGNEVQAAYKLMNASIAYELDKTTGRWNLTEGYELPYAGPSTTPGYDNGWLIEGTSKLLTPTSVVAGTVSDNISAHATGSSVVSKPTVEFTVNGNPVNNPSSGVQQLSVAVDQDNPGSVGVQVTHPLATEEARNNGTYVYFEYCWWDEYGNSVNGPRSETEPKLFSTAQTSADYKRVFTKQNEIPIRSVSDSRMDGDYYLVEIFGYYVEGNGTPQRYYKSGHNFIAGDNATDKSYLMNVSVTDTTAITITPADITVYTGGEGYTGIVDAGGNATTVENGLPEPGYYITLPDWLNDQLGGDTEAANLPDILTFEYKDENGVSRAWKLKPYGTEEHSSDAAGVERSRYIYRITPGVDENGNEIPVRLRLTDSERNVVISDEFTPSKDQQYAQYDMGIYSGGLDSSKITAKLTLSDVTTISCGVESEKGNLTVRGLTGEDITSEILTSESEVSGNKITAVAPDNATFFVNGSYVELENTEGIRLLADNLLDEQALVDYVKKNMSDTIPSEGYSYEQKYLDLVDSKNGNAFLTMGDGQQMDVYWPVPDDFDDGSAFYVIHFDALDRNYDSLEDQLADNGPEALSSELVTVNGTQYVKFSADSFSPFVLAYKQKSGGGSGTTNYTLHYNTNGGDSIDSETKTNPWTKSYSELPTPVRDGHSFEGWYFDSGLTDPVKSDVVVDRSSVTLYAGWKAGLADPDDSGVSDWLETEEHFPFMSGYPDGSFGPDAPITRAEIAQVFYNLLKDKDVEATEGFSDVPEGAWHEGAVNALASVGILEGVGGGLYDPDRNLTRAELAAIATRFADGNGDPSPEPFPDVSEGDWFAGAVSEAAGYGWIEGYPDGTFGPYREVTRAEAAAIVNRMLGRQADEAYVDANADRLRSFPDVPEGHWAYYVIMEASNWHKYAKGSTGETWRAADVSDWLETSEHGAYMAGYPDGTFGPDDPMTRAEAAQTLYNLLLRNDVGPEVSFPDVPQDAWYAEAVSRLAGMGMIKGFDDGTFRPDEKITRAEFAAIVSRFKDGDPSPEPFPDVSEGDWFAGAVSEAAGYGWIEGYPDGTFGPYREVTRAEAAAIVNRMLGRQADEAYVDANADRLRSFPDVPEGHWAYYVIAEAANAHLHKTEGGKEDWIG
ncbi:S-layer homology domain-containing protein [Collinsella tanakaei]|uniref:S-layer homology domain-containing protein n=1 Tax=Collinsella tanakaei TaxID=626935 RepID=UPI00265C97AA|nr:S-layer homology domain-containing protein [Collinsella tanakaei]